MKGLIIVNGYTERQSELNQAGRLQNELALLGVPTEIFRGNGFLCAVDNGVTCSMQADFAVYLDKERCTAQMLESKMRLFNSAKSIEICDDKMLTSISLAKNGIPTPKCFASPLCYTDGKEFPLESVEKLESELKYPFIVKECHGSLGSGVHLVKSREEFLMLERKLQKSPHVFQEYVEESKGRDIRVIVVGGEVVTAMKRENKEDFRSNLELGGAGSYYPVDCALKDLAEQTANTIGLDYCGIDVLFGKNGYTVCEVNSNAFFGGIEKVTGVNAAKRYAEYIVKEMQK